MKTFRNMVFPMCCIALSVLSFSSCNNDDDDRIITVVTQEQEKEQEPVVPADSFSTDTYPKNVLCEEFTSEKCPCCPRVAEYMAEIHVGDYENRVAVVCHHSGYYSDDYTQTCDGPLCKLYNSSSTYAPGIMVNRKPMFTRSGNNTCVTNPKSSSEITGYWDNELALTANAKVELSLQFNSDTTTMTVTASCTKNVNYNASDPRLTIYLTEDSIFTENQSYSRGDFYHMHVIRAFNSNWGDQISWDRKGNASLTYSFAINPAWKKKDLKVIAAISNYNESNVLDRAVENSTVVKVIRN